MDREGSDVILVIYAMLALHAFALIDAAIRPAAAFPAADKQTKNLWITLLALAVATDLLFPFFLFLLAGTVASLVYILDVRPAVRSLGGGRSWPGRKQGPRGW